MGRESFIQDVVKCSIRVNIKQVKVRTNSIGDVGFNVFLKFAGPTANQRASLN